MTVSSSPLERLLSQARAVHMWGPVAVALAAAPASALPLLDPRWLRVAWMPPLLVVVALVLNRTTRRRWVWMACSLAVAYWITALVGPGFGADSPAYYAYARSLLFDGDINFFNEWAHWGRTPLPASQTGLMMSAYSTGPALLWSPFVLVSHAYVRLTAWLGVGGFIANGYSLPYLRATAVGTLTYAVVGCWLLQSVLARRVGNLVAWLATLGVVATSPILFYLFVCPGVSHGLAFALAAGLVWALDTAEREKSRRAWLAVGVLLGLLFSVRWQAVVVAPLPIVLGLCEVFRRRVKLRWLLAAAGAGLLAFSPQLLAWRLLYGKWITMPTTAAGVGRGGWWFNPHSQRAWDVLFSAHHGLFIWTPFMLAGTIALVVFAHRWRFLGWAGLYLFAVTTWLNGSLADWHGSDAFGGRRFDVVLPFFALGLASLLRWLSERPMILPATALALGALWNVGLMRMFDRRQIPAAAPLDRVAAYQALQLRQAAEGAGEMVAGRRGRALAYGAFVGEFFFVDVVPSGVITVAAPSARRYLTGAWSEPMNRQGVARFRWARYPEACMRFPLDWPASSLAGQVTARAHPKLGSVGVAVSLNGGTIGRFQLGTKWSRLRFTLPGELVVPGENLLCLQFTAGVSGGREAGFAAAVTRIHIGS